MQSIQTSLIISIISLGIAISSLLIMVIKYYRDEKKDKESRRMNIIKEISSGFSEHNTSFIDYWDFPGYYPPLSNLKSTIKPAKDENDKLPFGQRVITLNHLNILLQVFTHKSLLKPEDITGYGCWAREWFEDSQESLKTILDYGDIYPLDFILWLRDDIFENTNFKHLFGTELQNRISDYEKKKK